MICKKTLKLCKGHSGFQAIYRSFLYVATLQLLMNKEYLVQQRPKLEQEFRNIANHHIKLLYKTKKRTPLRSSF